MHMARQCTQPKRPRNSAWFKEKMLLVQALESSQVFYEEQLAFLADPEVADVQDTQTIITHNDAFQTDDLDAYESDCDDISSTKAILMANLSSYSSDILFETLSKHVKEKESLLTTLTVFKKESKEKENKYMDKENKLENKIKELDNIVYKVGQSTQTVHMLTQPQVFYNDTHKEALGYQNLLYLKKAQWIKPPLYDGHVISKKHDVTYVVDEEETLMLKEESRSKMLAKQNDPILKEKKINISQINYLELNKLAEDFGKHFVRQKELSAEQAFWLQFSNPISEQPVIQTTTIRTEAPSELLKDLFKDFDNGLHSEINEVKMVFNQIKAAVEQCSADKRYFDIQEQEIFLDNDRLLQNIICQEVMNMVMHADSVPVNLLPSNNKCLGGWLFHFSFERLEQENDHLFEPMVGYYSSNDDEHNNDEDDEEHESDDDNDDNDDEDDDQENDSQRTELDDEGDDFFHPNLSTYIADDQEKKKKKQMMMMMT
ncbi:hypothetical protein Tco_0116138 [Tanacetum coccineum]